MKRLRQAKDESKEAGKKEEELLKPTAMLEKLAPIDSSILASSSGKLVPSVPDPAKLLDFVRQPLGGKSVG